MITVGITGGIGSGKTTVAKLFELLGIPVFYSDDAAKNLMNYNAEVKQKVVDNFGSECYIDGVLDRKYLASIVFSDKEKLDKLNSIVHEATGYFFQKWVKEQSFVPYVLKEAALIFEAGVKLDYVIGVSAPYELRLDRAMKRDGATKEAIENRMAAQMNEEEKMKLCDFIIMNDGSDLMSQIKTIHETIIGKI